MWNINCLKNNQTVKTICQLSYMPFDVFWKVPLTYFFQNQIRLLFWHPCDGNSVTVCFIFQYNLFLVVLFVKVNDTETREFVFRCQPVDAITSKSNGVRSNRSSHPIVIRGYYALANLVVDCWLNITHLFDAILSKKMERLLRAETFASTSTTTTTTRRLTGWSSDSVIRHGDKVNLSSRFVFISLLDNTHVGVYSSGEG